MPAQRPTKSLYLTEDEALYLLEMAIASAEELTPERRDILMKLGGFCREFLHEETETVAFAVLSPTPSRRVLVAA